MPTLRLSANDPVRVRADTLVVATTRGSRGPQLAPGTDRVDAAFDGRLLETIRLLGGTGKQGEVVRFATLGATTPAAVVAVGLGDEDGADGTPGPETLRRATGAAVRALAGTKHVALALPAESAGSLRAICEGALLGGYEFDRYREASRGEHAAPVANVTVITSQARSASAKAVVRRAEVIAESVALVRDLVNTPAADLHPADLARVAGEVTAELDVSVDVLDERALRRGGYGGLLGVGAGSAHPPRLVRLGWRPPKASRTLAIVGKGVTFDSGGLSLKPAASMEWMKGDMGGAAAVVGTVRAVAALQLPIAVTGWVPTAENMPSGSAIRPSDVLTMYGGKRVEVLNTDAEGRLIMADAIVRAAEEKPDWIVDVATLTGAQIVALGARTAGVMGNDEQLCRAVVVAADAAGEAAWPMPLPDELRKSIDSDIADITNTGDRFGGMLVAGVFLREFVPNGLPWAHLDIAGPAFNLDDAYGYTPKGGTGFGVRTLVQLIDDLAATAD